MSVATEVSSVSYVGAGSTGPFAIPFYFINDVDLLVIKETIATGALTELVLTTDYTLDGAGDEDGGELTLVVALAATHRVYIKLDPTVTQLTDYQRNDKFPAESHERALDRLTQICQRLVDKLKRAVKAPESITTDLIFGDTAYAARASKAMGFDAAGNLTLLSATELAVLLSAVATNYHSQAFNGDGADTTFDLSEAPASQDSTFVFVSGIHQVPGTDYTLAGVTVTFAVAPPIGVGNIAVMWSNAGAVSVVPADGSITTVKLAAGALAATVAGLAKMAAGFFQATADGLAKFADGFWQVGGHTKFADGFWADSAAVLAKFADGLWTFAKLDSGAIASQAEAEAGTSAVKLMTPQRTAQAIAALASGVNSGVMQVLGCDCKNNAGTPNTQFDLDADSIVLRTALSAIKVKDAPGAAITCNTATAGPAANGRDQAGAFAAGWVYFYWIYNPTTDSLATTCSNVAPPTGPALPAGYTYWAFAAAVYYDGAALRAVRVKGSRVYYVARQAVATGGVATVETAVSCVNFVPPGALAMMILANAKAAAGGRLLTLRYISGNDYAEIGASGVAAESHTLTLDLPNVSQQFYYLWNVAGDFDGHVLGYKIANGGE